MVESQSILQVHRIVNSVFDSNTFVLYRENSEDIWLVDCGDVDLIKKWCKGHQRVIKGVLITHTHFDHIYGINELLCVFPEIKVYSSEYGTKALFNDKMNFSHYHECPIRYSGKKPIILRDGNQIQLYENCILNVVETPGHCPSCLTYLVDKYIFTGDSYIPGIKVVTNLPKGNKVEAEESLHKILIHAERRIVCPGHS